MIDEVSDFSYTRQPSNVGNLELRAIFNHCQRLPCGNFSSNDIAGFLKWMSRWKIQSGNNENLQEFVRKSYKDDGIM